MAEHEGTVAPTESVNLSKFTSIGVVMAVVGLAGLFLLGASNIDRMLGSYMFGFTFWMSITFGCLGLSLLHHTVRGSWSFSILRLLESGGGWPMLIVMALLFLPVVLFGMHSLYEWTHHEVVQNDPILRGKEAFLNQGFWTLRFVGYFVIWILFAWYMRKSTERQEQSLNFREEAKRSSVGAVGMVAFMLTVTFAAIDWLMSMNPHWYSTMYGAWVVVGSAYGALAFCTAILCHYADKEPYKSIVSPNLTKDLGNMMFVLTMLWGYTTLSQFLIIWNGGIPETTTYFADRMAVYPQGMQQNVWAVVGFILIIGMFFIPFYSLLAPRTKRHPNLLKRVAIWQFLMAILNMVLIVVPSLPERAKLGPLTSHTITDILALIGVGGIWLIVFGFNASRAALVPRYDTRLQEAAKNAH